MEPLVRSVPFRASESTDGTTLEGYAAVFDSPTEIDSREGRFTEIIEKGAFAKAVRSNPRPVMQFDHGTHPFIGSIPIGAVEELREDDQGLYVRAELHSGDFFSPVREAIASGSISGMSFKFTIPKGGVEVSDEEGREVRTLTEVNLHELGPVVWPAYKSTTVGVRTQEIVNILQEDEEARHELMAGLVFADSLADRSTEEEPSEEADPSEEASAESDRTDEEEPSAAAKSRVQTVTAIVAAQAERVLRNDQERQFNNGTESETDGRTDKRPE